MAKLINKTQGFKVVPNNIFMDKRLSLKDFGLLVKLIGLPDNWEFSESGLNMIFRDGLTAIRSGLKNLEAYGYLVRRRVRDKDGKISGVDWEITTTPCTDYPRLENPIMDNPQLENPNLDNPNLDNVDNNIYNHDRNNEYDCDYDSGVEKDNEDGVKEKEEDCIREQGDSSYCILDEEEIVDKEWSEFARYYEQNIGLLPHDAVSIGDLEDYLKELSLDVIKKAIEVTCRAQVDFPKPYFMAILKKWRDEGITSAQKADAYIADYERKKENRKKRQDGKDEEPKKILYKEKFWG